MLLPVIFVVAQGESVLLLNAEDIGELEEMALILMAGRLADADDSSALVDEPADGLLNLRVNPPFAAGMGGICVAHVDDHINIVQNLRLIQQILKTEEDHIERSAGQRFDHSGIGIILFLVQCMVYHVAAPGAHFPPAVQHRDFF